MMSSTKTERDIADLYGKTVGAGLGLYNPTTKELQEDRGSNPAYQQNLESIRQALKREWTAADLKAFILQQYKAGTRATLLSEILPKTFAAKRITDEDDLMERSGTLHHTVFYQSTPPRYRVTEQGMELVSAGGTNRKAHFTFKQLCDYYLEQTDSAGINEEAVKGGMRWLLTQATPDQLLFAIDRAKGPVLLSPFQLTRYLEEAMQDILFYECRSN